MKKNLIWVAAAAIALAACDYNDQFGEIGKPQVPTDIRTLEYTLTDADYATLASLSAAKAAAESDEESAELAALKTTKAFTGSLKASKFIPYFLASYLPTVDNGSAVKVTYNYQEALPAEVVKISAGEIYALTNADYASIWGAEGTNYLTPSKSANSNIPALLSNLFQAPEEGDYVAVTYKYSETEPDNGSGSGGSTNPSTGNDWTDITSSFTIMDGSSFTSAYSVLTNAGSFSLSAYKGKKVQVAFRYQGDGNDNKTTTYQVDNIIVAAGADTLLNETFEGGTANENVALTGWTNEDKTGTKAWVFKTYSENTYAQMSSYKSGEANDVWLITPAIDLTGKDAALTFEVNLGYWTADCFSVLIREVPTLSAPRRAPNATTDMAALYKFNGTAWTNASADAYLMQKADYTSMGLNYDNFSGTQADQYIPTFLKQKYPYASEGAEQVVAYKYYANSVTTLAAGKYVLTAGTWTLDKAVITMTDQFVRNAGTWVYNPSVTINLAPVRNEPVAMSYYQCATNWVYNNVDVPLGAEDLNVDVNSATKIDGCKGLYYVTSYGNNEYYTGCSAYYNNVDWRVAKAREQYAAGFEEMSDEEALAFMERNLIEVMGHVLGVKHADAAPVEGVEVIYTVNVGIYQGTTINSCTHTMQYEVTAPGEFTYVEGSFKAIE